MSSVRRASALTLVVTLSLIGIPFPASAESPPLTINGLPLSQVLRRTALGDPLALAGLLGQETGQISGVAVTSDGQALAEHTIRAKRITIGENTRLERIVGTTTTDAEGQFSFTGLAASEYLVEALRDDEVVGSTPLVLAEGAMQVSGVSISASAMAESGGGIHPAVWVAIGVGAVVLVLVGAAYGILRRLARASQRLSE